MKLSTLYISSLTLLPSVISAAAIPEGVPLNGTLAKRGGEVNYLADCSRWVPSTSEQYPASYMAWYSNVDNSLDQQKPDSLSNEYRDWSAGGTWLTWEGQQHNIHFADSGVTVQTHIDSDASSRDFMQWAGWIQRTSDWRVFNCYKDSSRILFDWGPPVPDGTNRHIFCDAMYWWVDLLGYTPSAIFNQLPLDPTIDPSIQQLHDKRNFARSAALSLLTNTNWPSQSKEVANNLLQTINNLPDVPLDASVTLFKDTLVEFIRVLEDAHARVKDASEKYGRKDLGLLNGIKDKLRSRRRGGCTATLQACRDDIENASANLRNCLHPISTSGNIATGPVQGSETPSELQPQPNAPLFRADCPPEPLEPSRTHQTKPAEQAVGSEHGISHPTFLPDSSPGPPKKEESRSKIRDGTLITARQTFKTVEAMSGAIPVVGGFVGIAAKVGSALVNMIETMDKNEDVSEELALHTSKLSSCLEHFKKKVDAKKGDEVAGHVEDLRKYDGCLVNDQEDHVDTLLRELECVQEKVKTWQSSGRFKKLLLSSDHADELKANQDTIQTVLEEIQARATLPSDVQLAYLVWQQLLVSLKITDLVVELKNTGLHAERTRLLDRLGDGSYGARGAIEDVVCLPGTRVELLNRIDVWIKDISPSAQRVLWIQGMAGRGKSAIASTVAHSWASKGSCAIFHFRRGQNALDDRFLCALARQLGKALVPEVKNAILDCVSENEDIAKERLEQQFKTLFVGTLGKIQGHAHPIVIVVDALDECENVKDAVRFVRLLDRYSSLFPVNVKFLLTCRPETPLIVALEPRAWHAENLDSMSNVSEDVTLFLRHACSQIREDWDLPKTWPSSADLEEVVEMSQGLFQWARTAVVYIGDGSPEHRLRELLQHPSKWAGLDDLYHQILSRAFEGAGEDSEREQMLSLVLGTLVVAPYPVTLEVIAFLYADHEVFSGQENIVQYLRKDILAGLNSLLYFPTSSFEPVRLMHTSIRDLLSARTRCKNKRYFIDLVQNNGHLASLSLQIMQRDLKQNICNLPRLPKANSEIQDKVNRHVPSGLRYCCRSWSTHLAAAVSLSGAAGDGASIVLDEFQLFSDEELLYWLEVMSLIGAMTEAYTISKEVNRWLLTWPTKISNDSLNTLWNDIQRFITAFFEPISVNAYYIYAHALPRCPVETQIWLKYCGQATGWMLVGRGRNWSAHIWTASASSVVSAVTFSPGGEVLASGLQDRTVRLWDAQTGAPFGDPLTGHSDEITSVVFSSDGKVLATGSMDTTVRLWNVQTGAPLGDPLTGHSKGVTSVVFSPDGQVLASGSWDETVRLWDAQTETPLGDPLNGHSDMIKSVVFSPDSNFLASGSMDTTVRLWDVQTGAPLGDPLTGHSDGITSVVFSPDGKVLASGSWDETVRLWDAQTRALLGDPLTGHNTWITSVAFSPDGKVLASGSGDETVRLWDAQTGALLGDPLTDHSNEITSVAFSPDGRALASGSRDETIRLWDAQTGARFGGPVTGHSSGITSVVFSPDGKVLASGSWDETVRLWNAQTGAPLGDPLTGHGKGVTSVWFSPDSHALASGSSDNTVRLWDAQTGAPLGDPLTGHSEEITSVVFSPDGKVLASGSMDTTVRLWDVQTGAPLGDPLAGHSDWVASVVFSSDGKVLASGSRDETIRLWDAQTGAPLGDPLTSHSKGIMSVVFSPDSKVLASGSWGETVQLWDVQTGAPLGGPLTGHSDAITSVLFSPDGKVLASGSLDNTVQLWDAQTGAPLGDPLTGHSKGIASLLFSPGGKVLASVSSDGMIQFWHFFTDQMAYCLPSHQTSRF